MIREIKIDQSPMSPGERRPLRVEGDGPLTVAIKCFTNDPPPPGYKPCQACGSFVAQSGQEVEVTADSQFFSRYKGDLEITVEDATGDKHIIRLRVGSSEAERGPSFASA